MMVLYLGFINIFDGDWWLYFFFGIYVGWIVGWVGVFIIIIYNSGFFEGFFF